MERRKGDPQNFPELTTQEISKLIGFKKELRADSPILANLKKIARAQIKKIQKQGLT